MRIALCLLVTLCVLSITMARPSKQERRIKRPGSFASKVNDGNDGRKPNRRNGKDRPRKDGKPRPDDKPTDAQNPDDRPIDAPNPDNKPTDAPNPDNRPMARPKKNCYHQLKRVE